MKWKSALSQTGMQQNELSAKIKKVIDAYNDLDNEKQRVYHLVTDENVGEQRKEQLQEELDEINEAIQTVDEQLVQDINRFFKNKDRYAEMAEKMKKGREAKKSGKPTPAPVVAASGVVTPTAAAKTAANTVENNEEPIVIVEKKKGGIGLGTIVLAVGLGVLTFGAYNHLKNR